MVFESPSNDGINLKLRSTGGVEDNPYRFEMLRHIDADETSDSIPPLTEWHGSIGPSDTDGDNVFLQVGASNEARIAINSDSDINVDLINGTVIENLNVSGWSTISCPSNVGIT